MCEEKSYASSFTVDKVLLHIQSHRIATAPNADYLFYATYTSEG